MPKRALAEVFVSLEEERREASSAGGKRVCSSCCEGSEGVGFVGDGSVLVDCGFCCVAFGAVSEGVEMGGCDAAAVSWSLVEVGESGSKDLKESLSEDG